MNTVPINVNSRHPLFRKAPQLILALGYGLGLLVLIGAVSTYFVFTSVTVQTSGTLRPAIESVRLAQPALILDQPAHAGQQLQAGSVVAHITTSPLEIAQANLSRQIRASLATITSAPQPDAALAAQLQQTLGLLAATTAPQALHAPSAGWLLRTEFMDGKDMPIRQPGEPLIEMASAERVELDATVASDTYPGLNPGDPIKVLLVDFSGTDAVGSLEKAEVSTSFEFPLGQFSRAEQDRLHELTTLTLELAGQPLVASVRAGAQNYTFTVPLNALDAAARKGIKNRRSVHFQLPTLDQKKLSTKWGGLSSKLTISFAAASLPANARSAMREKLERGERVLPVESCWVQIASRRLFLRLFGS